jgi:uncharacterized NAD(P)/FAD-binding protein YdhS
MSAPQRFASVAAALEAFAAGRCKRWVSVEGHQIDLVQAQAEAGRVREEPAAVRGTFAAMPDAKAEHDARVARMTAIALARAALPCPICKDPECPRTLLTVNDMGSERRATACEEARLVEAVRAVTTAPPRLELVP